MERKYFFVQVFVFEVQKELIGAFCAVLIAASISLTLLCFMRSYRPIPTTKSLKLFIYSFNHFVYFHSSCSRGLLEPLAVIRWRLGASWTSFQLIARPYGVNHSRPH